MRLEEALHEGRVGLAEHPLVDRGGSLLRLQCPLRVQLAAGGPYRPAQRWLAMAARSRLLPQVDLMAVQLALIACARDGRPRGVQVHPDTLSTPGFVGDVQRALEAAPGAAVLLAIVVGEGALPQRLLPRLREAAAAWRRHGVRLGVEHAVASTQDLARLAAGGIDHVAVQSRYLDGAAADATVRDYARALLAMLHALGLAAIADGVADATHLAALRELGFDAAGGPAVTAQAMSPT